jgi:hypothetical protein
VFPHAKYYDEIIREITVWIASHPTSVTSDFLRQKVIAGSCYSILKGKGE